MQKPEDAVNPITPIEQVQKEWHEFKLKVEQLEADRAALEEDDKAIRFLLQRVIEHRQRSHSELVNIMAELLGKLPIRDIGLLVSKLVEHNVGVSDACTAMIKGKVETAVSQPAILKALDQTKRELLAAVKPAVEELVQLDSPLETKMLTTLSEEPDLFFSPAVVRGNRCYVKGQVTRERIVREFGDEALIFFDDLTTDSRRNPRPKPEEVVLSFKSDFEQQLEQHGDVAKEKRAEILTLYQCVQASVGSSKEARMQRIAFARLSILLELLHYYENQNTEAPDVIFAGRLPAMVEQLVFGGATDSLRETSIIQAEELLAFIVNPDHWQMVVNNIGKSGHSGKTLRHVLVFRGPKVADLDFSLAEFVRHLIPSGSKKAPPADFLAAVLKLIKPDMQRLLVGAIMSTDRLGKEEAGEVGRAIAVALNLKGLEEAGKTSAISPEMERQQAWDKIGELLLKRENPTVIAAAIRDRLHAKYDADEARQSWMTLVKADPITLIRTFCQLPYTAEGKTDPMARTVMQTYLTRLTHEKYSTTYGKVVTSLKNMFKAKPDSPTLVNFISLVKWVDPESAGKLAADIGMPEH